ncbi:hypothetical protein HK096_004006 [Nowakowskiella sp. JEL0078]|nr:hypothetical protein HK096_004006 [Nowakowskiella sp. JEL0078]
MPHLKALAKLDHSDKMWFSKFLAAFFALALPVYAASGFVSREGTAFKLNGEKFYATGSNNYYLMFAQNSDIDSLFADAKSIGLKYIRVWAWYEYQGDYNWFQNYTNGQQVFNDDVNSGLGRLDYVLVSAKRYGIKLIFVLTGNWSAFGGIDKYNQWTNATYHSDFYTKSAPKTLFKNYISHVLNRKNSISGVQYKTDSTIMAWELANEPRCVGSNSAALPYGRDPACTTHTLYNWVSEISSYIKKIDSNHLVAVGDEGFLNSTAPPAGVVSTWNDVWNGDSGLDFEAFLNIKTIDFGTFHSYMDGWHNPGEIPNDQYFNAVYSNNTVNWIKEHARIGKKVGKPVILEEYGTTDKTARTQLMSTWNKAVEDYGVAASGYWMIASNFYGSLYPDYDGCTIYANSTDVYQQVGLLLML